MKKGTLNRANKEILQPIEELRLGGYTIVIVPTLTKKEIENNKMMQNAIDKVLDELNKKGTK